MSSAFIDEDNAQPEELPEIPQSQNPGYITPVGLSRLNQELARLENIERPPLQESMESGDAGAAAAEIDLARIDQRIHYLKGRIGRAIVVDPEDAAPDRVHIGAVVEVRDQNAEETRYVIVGEDETDPEHHRVSCFSPLAQALMAKCVGDVVVWHRPIGDLSLTILSITPLHDNEVY